MIVYEFGKGFVSDDIYKKTNYGIIISDLIIRTPFMYLYRVLGGNFGQ